jgi:hypothetical protein
MSTVPPVGAPAAPAPHPRHALGLPAGSVRALLAFGVLALLWLLALSPVLSKEPPAKAQLPTAFVYLQLLMVLILASFFAAHGGSIGGPASKRSPLGLPRGTVRGLLLFGYLALAVYLYRTRPEFQLPDQSAFLLLLLVLLSGFFLGHVLTAVVRGLSGGILPPWFQDIQAWVAILAMFALGAILVIQLFINPSLEQKLDLPWLDATLAGLVGFYFGARA